MKKILFWSLVLLPTLLFATDMGGIFFVILWVVLGYQSIYNVLTGLLIHLFIKKKFYSLFPKVLVYFFLILGIITGGALLTITVGLCFEPIFARSSSLKHLNRLVSNFEREILSERSKSLKLSTEPRLSCSDALIGFALSC